VDPGDRTGLGRGRAPSLPPPGVQGLFALSDPDTITERLDAAGYFDIDLERRGEPMWFGHEADDARSFIVGLMGWMLEGLDDHARAGAVEELHGTLVAHETDEGVCFDSATWITRATRR